jgi:hypothetical protein
MKITKKELREVIQEVAEEMGLFEGLTAAQEKLPEPLKKAILKKQESDGASDDSEDVDEGLTKAQEKLPEPLKKAILKKQESDGASDDDSEEESIEEGNAFGAAVKAARENGENEFEVGGKTYQLKEKVIEEGEDTEEFIGDIEDEVEEGNAFGSAVTKAKEDGDSEFEVDGKTYKVKEQSSSSDIGNSDNHVDAADCKDCEDPGEGELTNEEVDDEDEVEEGNAFGSAVTKAKEDGDTEFEVGGKTYKVSEDWKKVTLAEKLDRIMGNRRVL